MRLARANTETLLRFGINFVQDMADDLERTYLVRGKVEDPEIRAELRVFRVWIKRARELVGDPR